MKNRFDRIFPTLFVGGDVAVVAASFLLMTFIFPASRQSPSHDLNTFSVLMMVWVVITVLRKDYRWDRTSEPDKIFGKLLGSLVWFLALIAIVWMPEYLESSRVAYYAVLSTLLFVLLGCYRIGIQMILRKYRSMGYNYENAVIIGEGGTSQKLADIFHRRRDFGIRFLGFYTDDKHEDEESQELTEFYAEAIPRKIDVVYINENLPAKTIKKLIHFADENYIKVKVIPQPSLQIEKNLSFSKYGDFFVININEIPLDNVMNRILKRAFDVTFSLLVTVLILSWLIPLMGLLIKLESKGSVFFVQERNGVNNHVFKCLKFRSMTPNDYSDTHQAVKNDPRITKIGAFLRQTSLDETPQFLNVLMGDMSIVGPRPHTIPMNKVFSNQIDKYNFRHKIKPGITGLAQVRGFRGEIENSYQIRSRVKLDYFYIENWSLFLDIVLCFRTLRELLTNKGHAY